MASRADLQAGGRRAQRDAHEREAATREILEVISRSRDDERPVFDAILRNASRLCKAPLAFLPMANEARTHVAVPAFVGVRPEFADALKEFNEPIGSSNLVAVRAVAEGRMIRSDDLTRDPAFPATGRWRKELTETEGARSVLVVPLMRGEAAIGAILLYRREVEPFDDDDVALVETFAAQAVIAIENVRQFRELQSRLEREKATREILEVISRSRDDDQPVFDVIVENACRLCDAPHAGLYLVDDARSEIRLVTSRGARRAYLDSGQTVWPLDNEASIARAVVENRVVHAENLAETDAYLRGDPMRRAAVDLEGIRTYLAVPLVSGGRAIGCIGLYRREVAPFGADQIALIETFAAQAVIAIENVRQFRELQSRLEREKATREILEVISRSRDDEQPVFEIILETARRLCGATMSAFVLGREGGGPQVMVANHGATEETLELYRSGRFPMDPEVSTAARAIIERRSIHLEDMADTEGYRNGHPNYVALVDHQGIRTNLLVPLISRGEGIGCLILHRQEVRPYAADQIALVETFAAQAAIAIENVRQFRELQERTEEVRAQAEELRTLNTELESRVEAQVGELERLGRLKRFLSPQVADAVVSSGDEAMLGSHRALIAVLFCDIRGFTAFCETAEPEETIEILQTYHEEMGDLIRAHGAGVDHRSGDGIMAIFNDPLPCDDPAGDALRMALEMRDRMAELSAGWRRLGHRLGFGVGISLGYATVGVVGSEGRYDYTASGTTVNLAARLCDHAADGEILLSPRAYMAIKDEVEAVSHGSLELKGIKAPVEVYRVAGRNDADAAGPA